jgi:hypothetical protein
MTLRKGELTRAALLPPRQQRTISHRHILLVNSSPRSTLTRAFSISRCRSKGTRRLKTQGHFRRHGALAADDIVELLARDPDLPSRP